ncbi:glycerol-3-phosphate responsive antiterminator [Vallitalea okinawensis]|uniref:glycerol-3-phosphate responsive antiterminator n=1 Tax=Vallitalea okinawensis TaxID=2078660 RepID=UPI000CFB498C|nr:glycerol-3-phosphate responsive antiterminator [Vallitalea okinawensis]
MNTKEIYERLEINPIIAAIRYKEDLVHIHDKDVNVVFILHSDILSVGKMVKELKELDKVVFIHLDFIEGLGKDQKALEFICRVVKPHGIISTRSSAIKYGKEMGIFTIQRFFLVDSLSCDTTIRTIRSVKPDLVELMPGVLPKTIKKISHEIRTPIIAGGLINDKEDIIEVLKAGALGVSMGNYELWEI